MNIEGLDYNTQREKLMMPEYGREIQNMVDYAITLPTRAERQRCAHTIVKIMDIMVPQTQEAGNHEQKLWDHLALMSGFRLDIDWPFDVSQAAHITKKPEPLAYPMQDIPVRHYGSMVFELFEKLKEMPDGEERDRLISITANQMKRNLMQWGHGSADDEKVVSDLARFTNGKVQIDLDKFKFEKIRPQEVEKKRKKK
ncbi:MAG: DUF4290 domain-containing protein [Prevotella sp.]|nr:DUF4290 domain-containing protein [Prevotella sp.]